MGTVDICEARRGKHGGFPNLFTDIGPIAGMIVIKIGLTRTWQAGVILIRTKPFAHASLSIPSLYSAHPDLGSLAAALDRSEMLLRTDAAIRCCVRLWRAISFAFARSLGLCLSMEELPSLMDSPHRMSPKATCRTRFASGESRADRDRFWQLSQRIIFQILPCLLVSVRTWCGE